MSPMLQPKCSQILLRTAIDTSSSRRSFVIVFGEISAALRKSALLIFYRSAASAVCCNWLTAWLLYPPHIYVFVSLPVLMNTVYHIFSLFAIHFRWFLHMSRLFEVEFRNLLRNMICKTTVYALPGQARRFCQQRSFENANTKVIIEEKD